MDKVEWEGFTNKNTFEIAHCITNTPGLLEDVKRGLHVCARRKLGWDPAELSHPFTTALDSNRKVQITMLSRLYIEHQVIPQLEKDCGGELEDFSWINVDINCIKDFLIDQYMRDAMEHASMKRYYLTQTNLN